MPDYLTVKNAAELLSVTVHFIYSEIRSGRLTSIRLGKKMVRIARSDFELYIASQRH